jgi:predicted enzyme related to lactoylglutathione lyase
MQTNANALNWFEIPATDIKRAKKFYEAILDIQMEESEMMNMRMAFFPYEMGSSRVSGALCQSDFHKPGMDGAIIYLNGNPDLKTVLDKIETAGGKIIMSKTEITPEIGYMAFFIDSEGNRMALHSQK